MTDEKINHPPHYGGDTTYEAIKVIEAWQLDFALGNAVKYICRAGKKPGASAVDDLCKARFYLDRAITCMERNKKADARAEAMTATYEAAAPREPSNGQEVGVPLQISFVVCPKCHQTTSMERNVAAWRCLVCGAHIQPNDPGFDEICKTLNPGSQLPKDTHERY